MPYTNESLEKINQALKITKRFQKEITLVEKFKADILRRVEVWLKDNYRTNFDLPSPEIIFVQPGWEIEIANLDAIINSTEDTPVEIRYTHPILMSRVNIFFAPIKVALP